MIPAGWYTDPAHRHEYRYWDGTNWTALVSDGGVTASDSLESPPIPKPKPPGAGALAWWAMSFGIFNTSTLVMFLLGQAVFAEPTPVTGYNPGVGGALFGLAMALPGVVLGILALARPGHGHDRRRRRSLAWNAIGLSLFSFAGWSCLFLFA